MYWSNYHSHNTFCDGRSTMEEFVKFAIEKNVRKYGFSSHAPLPFNTFWNMKLDDFEEYQAEFWRLKEKYSFEIELFIGLEVDYIHNFFEIQNNLFRTDLLDYLIGSVHYMDKLPNGDFWCVDGNFNDFKAGLNTLFDGDIREAVKRYFEIINFMIEKGGFDIVGHVDKIAMNASNCADFNIQDKWYINLVSETFERIKNKGFILEINTKSLSVLGKTFPDNQFFPLINELQIPITVNSDCHYPTNITDGFIQTFKALKNAGFTSVYQLSKNGWQSSTFTENGIN
jgi:histidinol-phosphatase (PHP family)